MKIDKKIDLGEYIVEVEYDDATGGLDITVYDELESVISSLTIFNDEDSDDISTLPNTAINPTLN